MRLNIELLGLKQLAAKENPGGQEEREECAVYVKNTGACGCRKGASLRNGLHAPTSATRLSLMPIEKRYRLPDVLEAIKAFQRRVTFEYVLIEGVNDRDEDLAALARIAKQAGALVNLLPLHPGGAPQLVPASRHRLAWFAGALRRRGVEAVARRSRGLDIAAACGQLRVARGEAGGEVAADAHRDVHEAAGIGKLPDRADA